MVRRHFTEGRPHWALHLSFGDVIFLKVALSLLFVAVFFVPEYLTMPVALSTNLLWLWRL